MSVSVFVSSTFSDLQPYRSAVRDALHRLGSVVRGMEFFGALPDTPRDECLRIVSSCQIYVGIVGMRYGSVDAESGKSFTHLEYEEAIRSKLPSLIYLVDEERQPILPKHIDFGEAAQKLQDLKNLLKTKHVVSFFTSPEDLAVRVSQDLPQLVQRMGSHVDTSALEKVVASLPRVDWITPERFAFLKRELGGRASIVPSDALLKEVMEFLFAGDRLAAVFLLSRHARVGMDEATDALMEIETRLFEVVARGTNALRLQSKPAAIACDPKLCVQAGAGNNP